MADPRASAEVRVLTLADAPLLSRVADGVFDYEVQPALTEEFLADPRHSLAVAIADGLIVGMASGVRYVHPDKPSELWINEVGVSPDYQRRGLAYRGSRESDPAGEGTARRTGGRPAATRRGG